MIDGMMYNTLIVIDNYEMKEIHLDDRKSWTIGRNTENNAADIPIKSHRVSRKHGKFICESGIWFYYDTNSMNGTIYNGNKILPGLGGRINPVMLSDGDYLVYGGGDKAVVDLSIAWAFFFSQMKETKWRKKETYLLSKIKLTDGEKTYALDYSERGKVIRNDNGIAIYMGAVTFMTGKFRLVEKGN